MQPATIRRLLVFGVCLVGVGGLYLAPTVAGAPAGRGATPAWHDLPTSTPYGDVGPISVTSPSPGTAAGPADSAGTGTDPAPTGSRSTAVGEPTTDTPRADGARRTVTVTTRRTAATAAAPGRDRTPPGPVGRPTVSRLDPDRLTVIWPEATDDVGVVSYHVWLNGFLVLDTQERRANLTWFNDSSTHVVQVQALDAVGNQGPSSPTLLVVRPSPTAPPPDPSPSAPLTPPTSPSPTASDVARGPALAPPAPTDSGRPGDTDQEDSS